MAWVVWRTFSKDDHSGFEQNHTASVLQHGLEVTAMQLAPSCDAGPVPLSTGSRQVMTW